MSSAERCPDCQARQAAGLDVLRLEADIDGLGLALVAADLLRREQQEDRHTLEDGARATGFSAVHGHVGYLREAYHYGGPYVTCTSSRRRSTALTARATIQASVFRDLLPAAVLTSTESTSSMATARIRPS